MILKIKTHGVEGKVFALDLCLARREKTESGTKCRKLPCHGLAKCSKWNTLSLFLIFYS